MFYSPGLNVNLHLTSSNISSAEVGLLFFRPQE